MYPITNIVAILQISESQTHSHLSLLLTRTLTQLENAAKTVSSSSFKIPLIGNVTRLRATPTCASTPKSRSPLTSRSLQRRVLCGLRGTIGGVGGASWRRVGQSLTREQPPHSQVALDQAWCCSSPGTSTSILGTGYWVLILGIGCCTSSLVPVLGIGSCRGEPYRGWTAVWLYFMH